MVTDATEFLVVNFRRVGPISVDANYTAHGPRPLGKTEIMQMRHTQATAHRVTRPSALFKNVHRPAFRAYQPVIFSVGGAFFLIKKLLGGWASK
jgi:hypothetical protein